MSRGVPIDGHRVPVPGIPSLARACLHSMQKLSLRFLDSIAHHLDMRHAASLYSPPSWLMVIGACSGGLRVWIYDHPLASRN
jgi:hypothetical protein